MYVNCNFRLVFFMGWAHLSLGYISIQALVQAMKSIVYSCDIRVARLRFPMGGREEGNKTARVRLPFSALCPAIVTVIESILDESQSNSSPSFSVCLSLSSVFRRVASCPSFLCSHCHSHNKIPQTPFVASDPALQMTAIIQNINERGFCTLLCI